jgi:hypothetical protein
MISLKCAEQDSEIQKPQSNEEDTWTINSNDEGSVASYESVRRQLQADEHAGGRYRFVGESSKQYDAALAQEMNRRQLNLTPINWPL